MSFSPDVHVDSGPAHDAIEHEAELQRLYDLHETWLDKFFSFELLLTLTADNAEFNYHCSASRALQHLLRRRCRWCGCTEDNACDPVCWWIKDPMGGDLCSSCQYIADDQVIFE